MRYPVGFGPLFLLGKKEFGVPPLTEPDAQTKRF